MKRVMMIIAGVLISSFIFAQAPARDHRKGEHADRMKSALALTDQQVASIKSINKKYGEQQRVLRKDSISRVQNADKIKSLQKQRREEISKVLTPEQRTKWDSLKRDHAGKRKHDRKEQRANRKEKIKTDLGLTDDQWTKFSAENKRFHEERKTLGKNPDPAKLTDLRSVHEKNLKSILTEQQFQKWSAMKKDARLKQRHR